MAKTTQNYSANAASNTALIAPDGTQIPLGEGQTLPKHVNDAFRALMADTAIAAKFSGLPAGRSIALTVRLVANTDSLGSFPAVGGQKLELDGAVNPALVLAGTTAAPHTYTFDTSDSSMTGALRFYEDASQTTEYTTGVTVSSGQTTIAVTDTTPGVLYYQLAGSAGLGGIAYVLGTSTGGGGGLSSVVQDTTPELGGDLDLNSSDVTGTGNINITGTITTTGSGSFANVTVTGTVDGRDVSADGAKLDGIETGATADQTGAEIKTAYEGEANTNAFTDAEKTKLAGIEASATGDLTGAEIKSLYEAETNAFTDAQFTKLAGIETGATADQSDAEIKTAYENNANTNAFTDAEQTKLSGIETGATADQTGAEIKSLYEAETNAFTDAQFTKLAGIETGATADQSDAEIKTAYENNANTNAFTDAEKTKLSGIEASATADQTGAEIKSLYEAETNAFTDAQFTKLAGIETGATADQTGAEIKSLYEAETNAFTDAQFTKLSGIETNATADQTDAEIKTAYENNANTNAFTDAEKTKLSGIETNATADQTGAEIKTAYEGEANTNAFTDAEQTKLSNINQGVATTDSVTFGGLTVDGSGGGNRSIELGAGRTADGNTLLDFVTDTTYTDYGMRLVRFGGANSASQLIHRGTGVFTFRAVDGGGVQFKTGSAGPGGADTLNMFVTASGDIRFYEDDGTTQGLTWDASTGRLGVGATAPASTLDVDGEIRSVGVNLAQGNAGVVDARFAFNQDGTQVGWIGAPQWDSDGLYIYGPTASSSTEPVLKYSASQLELRTSNTNRLVINSSGVVRISNLAGSGTQDVQADASGNLVRITSDQRLKKEIADSPYGLAAVQALRPVTYRWRNEGDMGSATEVGFVAQEVQAVIPEMVNETHATGMLSVSYSKLTAVLTAAIKEQQTQIEALEARLAVLEATP